MSRRNRIPGTRRGGVLYVLPEILDDLSPAEKSALALRNACTVEGRCPDCGATPEAYRNRNHDGIYHLIFRHEPWCGALTDEAA